MSKIKVGQIYKTDRGIYVVTRIWFNFAVDKKYIDCVYEDGTTADHPMIMAEGIGELIAEYPTWQEAVNSKEFRNECI